MTYLEVHTLFLVLPTLFALRRVSTLPSEDQRYRWQALLALVVIASVWTTPWDNLMVVKEVWTYPPDAVIGTILYVPIEEHLFFVMQPIFTGALALWVVGEPDHAPRDGRVANLMALFVIAAFTLFALMPDLQSTYYLRAIFLWFLPPLALQLLAGGDRLARRWRPLVGVWFATTVFLCLVDGLAMRKAVWSITDATSIGIDIGNVPVEEIAFFAITNALVIAGTVLYVDIIGARRAR